LGLKTSSTIKSYNEEERQEAMESVFAKVLDSK
jgi:hypothetical protein